VNVSYCGKRKLGTRNSEMTAVDTSLAWKSALYLFCRG